jgi:hypothetical protein
MPKFVFSDPVDLNPDDVVSAETTIRAGSIVIFDRRGKNRVVITSLSNEQVRNFSGSKYTVAKGDRPGEIKFSMWKPT